MNMSEIVGSVSVCLQQWACMLKENKVDEHV